MKPVRIQLQRTRGWRMPPNTVWVARPSRWGNPFRVISPNGWSEASRTAAEAVSLYREWISGKLYAPTFDIPPTCAELKTLAGKNLACFCKLGNPCHADVLLELACEPVPETSELPSLAQMKKWLETS